MSERSEIGAALFQLLAAANWGAAGVESSSWAYRSQRLQTWDDCPAQPAFYLQSGDERHATTTNGVPVRVFEYRVVVYQNDARDTTLQRPADTNDAILGAIEELIPAPTPDQRQTLGGLVHTVKLQGTLMRDDGDLDGQAMMIIPIEVVVP